MRVGILGRAGNAEVCALRDALEREGATPTIVDFHGLPHLHTVTWGDRFLFDDIKLRDPIAMRDQDAWHLRAAAQEPMSDAAAAGANRETVARHHRKQVARLALQLGLARHLASRVPVINPPDAFRFHRQKAYQHTLLVRHGIPTPETVVTASVDEARAFVDRWGGRAVAKPQASGAEVVLADASFFETFALRSEGRPTMFQQYVRGSSYRAYVLGGRIVSMGHIVPEPGYVDWRERVRSVSRMRPSEVLARQVAEAVRLLDLPCCGVDIEHDEVTNNDYLLDFNPAAMFVAWSRRIGDDVPAEIARYLVACARTGEVCWGT
jgi:glutathione synthase/RimK-type ligase-like ATP-grasp enzyme